MRTGLSRPGTYGEDLGTGSSRKPTAHPPSPQLSKRKIVKFCFIVQKSKAILAPVPQSYPADLTWKLLQNSQFCTSALRGATLVCGNLTITLFLSAAFTSKPLSSNSGQMPHRGGQVPRHSTSHILEMVQLTVSQASAAARDMTVYLFKKKTKESIINYIVSI